MLGTIWAQDLDGVIGDGADMPWHLPEDLKHFKEITYGHPIIMGRRTWEALPKRPLPGRANHILSSRDAGRWSDGAFVSRDLPDLETDAWIIGGAQLYEATIDEVDVIERTLIDAHFAESLGSRAVFAPRVPAHFEPSSDTGWLTSATGMRYRFQCFERKDAPSVTVYATSWCPYCRMLLSGLKRTEVDYVVVDVDDPMHAEESQWVASVNGGNRIVPTVRFADGTHLTNPSAGAVVEKYNSLR